MNQPEHESPARPGRLLVASRALEQTPFARSVVLLLQKNADGTFGVVLNRPAEPAMIEAWEKVSHTPEHARGHIACGGPLGGPVVAVHREVSLADIHIREDLFVTASADALHRLIDSADCPYRIFMGVAGWKEGQLEQEIAAGCWYLSDGDGEDVIGDTDHLWERCLIRYGRRQLCDILRLPDIVVNPAWN